jgi:hypothetical protein
MCFHRPLLVLLSLLTLAACNSSTRLDGRPVLELRNAAPPVELTRPCDEPQRLPRGGLTQAQAVRLWARDRKALVDCGERFDATIQFYEERDAGLAGEPVK